MATYSGNSTGGAKSIRSKDRCSCFRWGNVYLRPRANPFEIRSHVSVVVDETLRLVGQSKFLEAVEMSCMISTKTANFESQRASVETWRKHNSWRYPCVMAKRWGGAGHVDIVKYLFKNVIRVCKDMIEGTEGNPCFAITSSNSLLRGNNQNVGGFVGHGLRDEGLSTTTSLYWRIISVLYVGEMGSHKTNSKPEETINAEPPNTVSTPEVIKQSSKTDIIHLDSIPLREIEADTNAVMGERETDSSGSRILTDISQPHSVQYNKSSTITSTSNTVESDSESQAEIPQPGSICMDSTESKSGSLSRSYSNDEKLVTSYPNGPEVNSLNDVGSVESSTHKPNSSKSMYSSRRYPATRTESILGTRVTNAIRLDVSRTYPTVPFFAGVGKLQLERVLHAFAFFDSDICYIQGINFVAAALLWHCSEEDAFWLLLVIVYFYNARELLQPGMPGLLRRCEEVANMPQNGVALLKRYMAAAGVTTEILISGWMLTLFASVIPLSPLAILWDAFFSEGWMCIYRLVIYRFTLAQDDLLTRAYNLLGNEKTPTIHFTNFNTDSESRSEDLINDLRRLSTSSRLKSRVQSIIASVSDDDSYPFTDDIQSNSLSNATLSRPPDESTIKRIKDIDQLVLFLLKVTDLSEFFKICKNPVLQRYCLPPTNAIRKSTSWHMSKISHSTSIGRNSIGRNGTLMQKLQHSKNWSSSIMSASKRVMPNIYIKNSTAISSNSGSDMSQNGGTVEHADIMDPTKSDDPNASSDAAGVWRCLVHASLAFQLNNTDKSTARSSEIAKEERQSDDHRRSLNENESQDRIAANDNTSRILYYRQLSRSRSRSLKESELYQQDERTKACSFICDVLRTQLIMLAPYFKPPVNSS